MYMLCFETSLFNHNFGLLLEIKTGFHMWQELLAAMTPHRAVHLFAVQTQHGIAYSLTRHGVKKLSQLIMETCKM